jgi:hypothetical protein
LYDDGNQAGLVEFEPVEKIRHALYFSRWDNGCEASKTIPIMFKIT